MRGQYNSGESYQVHHDDVSRILTADCGRIEFDNCVGRPRHYIRVNEFDNRDNQGSCDRLLAVLINLWHLPKPNIVISVTGGTKNFQMKNKLRTAFKRGLVKLTRTTRPWIISEGTDTGIMKVVGEAVHDFNITSQRSIVAIGIATWGAIEGRNCLRNTTGDNHKTCMYPYSAATNKAFLNPNHTHFILVDDGSNDQFGKEIAFRAEIEQAIANMTIEDGTVSIPVVLLVVEGGKNTIKTVLNAIKKRTPTIVFKGSGRAADLIAYGFELAREMSERFKEHPKESLIAMLMRSLQSRMVEMNTETEEIWSYAQISDVCTIIDMCLTENDLITVFDITASLDVSQDIDVAMLKALIAGNKDQPLNQLKLAVFWNRIEIANSDILHSMNQRTIEAAMADEKLILSALILDRADFIETFLENGLELNALLDAEILKELFEEYPPHFIPPLKPIFGVYKYKSYGRLMNGVLSDKCDYSIQRFAEDRYQQLFLWSVLTGKQEMAKVLWKFGQDQIAMALIACRLLKKISKSSRFPNMKDKLTKNAEEFCQLALDITFECFENDDEKAMDLLMTHMGRWEDITCIEIALMTNNRKFAANGLIQYIVDAVWCGEISSFTRKGSPSNEDVESEDSSSSQDSAFCANVLRAKHFLQAPWMKHILYCMSHTAFLLLFSYAILFHFDTRVTEIELILTTWVICIVVDYCMQVPTAKDFLLNFLNFPAVALYSIGYIQLYLPYAENFSRREELQSIGRIYVALAFVCFFLKLLGLFSTVPHIGPKVTIIKKMVTI
ncbi:transient receptor potential cation channel subfamily M member 2-like [Ylistrum balloti]|uniref:transient receptor potential cation channel subfamily M member 2-like n=1 Tax=Ylistrum balloti TaxID=509963 RepID=UPI002905B6BE|nr:transient receptor potential cation channel subfamily M member 2-like [Ylistrum balloti]